MTDIVDLQPNNTAQGSENGSGTFSGLSASPNFSLLGYATGIYQWYILGFTLNVPQGATIDSAVLSVYQTNTTTKTNYRIGLVAEDDAEFPTLTGHCTTDYGLLDSLVGGVLGGSTGYKNLLDISSLIQTRVNSASWASGNKILIYCGHSTSFDFIQVRGNLAVSGQESLLNISYTASPSGGGSSSPVYWIRPLNTVVSKYGATVSLGPFSTQILQKATQIYSSGVADVVRFDDQQYYGRKVD